MKKIKQKTIRGILNGCYNKKPSRTKNQIYQDLKTTVEWRYIYKLRYTTSQKLFLLNELYKQFKCNSITTRSLLRLERQYSI